MNTSYKPDPNFSKIMKRQMYLIVPFVLSMMMGMMLFSPFYATFSYWFALLLIGFLAVVVFIAQKTTVKKQVRNWDKLEVFVSDEAVSQYYKGKQSTISFADIEKATFWQDKQGQLQCLRVESQQEIWQFAHLIHLNRLAGELKMRLPATAVVKQKRVWVNWQAPAGILLGCIGLMLFGAVYGQILSTSFMSTTLLMGLFVMLPGVLIISGKTFFMQKRYEPNFNAPSRNTGLVNIVLGCVFIGMALLMDGPAAFGVWSCGWWGKYVEDSGCVKTISIGGEAAYFPDSQTLAIDDNNSIFFTPSSNWIGVWTPHLRHDDSVRSFQLAADGRTLVSTTSSFPLFGSSAGDNLWVWDVSNQTVLHKELYPDLNKNDISISANGRYLSLPSTKNKETQIWQVNPWRHHLTLPETYNVIFHPDGQSVVGTHNGEIVLLDVNDGAHLQSFAEPESIGILSLQLSADGRTLVGLDFHNRVLQWDVATGALKPLIVTSPAEFQPTYEDLLAVSADGRWAATFQRNITTDHYIVHLIDLQAGQITKSIDLGQDFDVRPQSLSFSPDGQNLAIGSWGNVMIFAVDERK